MTVAARNLVRLCRLLSLLAIDVASRVDRGSECCTTFPLAAPSSFSNNLIEITALLGQIDSVNMKSNTLLVYGYMARSTKARTRSRTGYLIPRAS